MRRLQLVGLVVLAVVTLIVSVLALTRYREPVPQAATPAPQTQDAASWPADEPAEESEPAPEPEPLTPLQEVGVRLAEPGASVMVIGDGTGNEDDEWVAVWARDYWPSTGESTTASGTGTACAGPNRW